MSGRGYAAVLAAAFVGYVALAAWVPPFDDELYYWCWSKEPQLSYFDHPPLVAYLIRGSTAVFGDSLAAVRLPACVASVAVLAVVGRLTRPRGFALLALLTPLFTFGAVLVTPDTPLLLFWSLYLLWLVAAHRRLSDSGRIPLTVWLVGGLLLGGGLLGKYTAALLVPTGGFSFLLLGWANVRRWAAGYVAHLLVAAAAFAPVLVYNAERGFAPLLYQWGHATEAKASGVKTFGEFAGTQVVLAGTLPFVLLPWVVWRWKALAADGRLRACACLYALPLALFTLKSFTGPLEGNWALAAYVGFWPVAADWWTRWTTAGGWRRWAAWIGTALAFLPPLLVVGAVGLHLVWPLPAWSPKTDRITRQHERGRLADRVAEHLAGTADRRPLFTPEYQWVALLRYHGIDAQHEPEVTRPSHFTQSGRRLSDHSEVLYFSNYPLPAGHADEYAPTELLAEFPLSVRGEPYDTYKLWLYRRAPAPHP